MLLIFVIVLWVVWLHGLSVCVLLVDLWFKLGFCLLEFDVGLLIVF